MKLSSNKTFAASAVTLIAASQFTSAAILAQFNFDGNDYSTVDPNGSTSFAPQPSGTLNFANTATAANVTVSSLQSSPGIDLSWSSNSGDAYDGTLGVRVGGGTFLTGTADEYTIPNVNNGQGFGNNDKAVFFTITVADGFSLDLTSFDFDSLTSRGSNPTSRTTHSFFVNPAADPSVAGLVGSADLIQNFGHDHGTPGAVDQETTGANFSTGIWSVPTADLSALTGLTGTQTFALRSYSGSGRDFGFDNIVVQGDIVAVPEPSSIALLGLGGLALLRRRRRS